MERFLERVSVSEYRNNFILKGGMPVASIVGVDMRATMDIDTTVKALPLNEKDARAIIERIGELQLEDGVNFRITSVKEIMEEFDYPGIRMMIEANLERMRQPFKIDISTDDAITPGAVEYKYKLMFEDRSISVLSYNLETLLAEKMQTILARGLANTRMRDFYDVYEKTSTNYKNVEASGIDYIKRTLKKRISVYTNGQLDADDIFDTAKEKIDIYYKTLFYASAGIPRSLGYILKYSFLNSINKGNGITIADLNNASKTYFVNNILADFCNDSRYKESFFDENKILTQMTQKKLMDDLIEMAKTIKRGLIEKYTGKQSIKDIYKLTLEMYKSGITYWLPTSHFYIDKEIESILQTLELYYIVSKFNEGSSRKPGIRVSYYGLNYGLCLENQIDYGKPEFRRAYDYWRQDEFDYTDFIPAAINAVEVPKCSNCGYEYKEKAEYEVAKKFGFCLNCQEKNCIQEVNQLEEIMKEQIAKWRSESLPDIEIDILRVLHNNRQHEMSAVEIGNEVDRHHLAITKIMEKLSKRDYVSYVTRDKRYYSIKEKAISIFFNDVMETAENENS